MATKHRATYSIDIDLIAKLDKVSAQTNISRSAFINSLLKEALENYEIILGSGLEKSLSQTMRLLSDKLSQLEDLKIEERAKNEGKTTK